MKYITTIIENFKESWPFIKENNLSSILFILLIAISAYFLISKIHLTKINNLKEEKRGLEQRLGINAPIKNDLSFQELQYQSACLIYDVSSMMADFQNKQNTITSELRDKEHNIFLEKIKSGIHPIDASNDLEVKKLRDKELKFYKMYDELICYHFNKTFKANAYSLYKKLLKFNPNGGVKIKPYFESYFYMGDQYSIQNILKTINDLSNNKMVDEFYRPINHLNDPRLMLINNGNSVNFIFALKFFFIPFTGICIGLFFFFFKIKIVNLESSVSNLKSQLSYRPREENKYMSLSNQDLKVMGNNFIDKLDEFIVRWEKSESELEDLSKVQRGGKQEDYLKWLDNDYRNLRITTYKKYSEEYDKSFKNDALNYQEALLKKLNRSFAEESLKNKEAYLLTPRYDTSIKNNINDIYRSPKLASDINIIRFDLTSMIEEL